MQLESIRQALLQEIKLADFKGRHLFVARLRLIVFFVCWLMFVVFYRGIWQAAPFVPLVFNVGFLVTAICYFHILHERNVFSMTGLEVLADVISQTTVIYLLGADTPVVFLFYGMYVIAAGSFFGYILALMAATLALLSYCFLVLLLSFHLIAPFHYPHDYALLFTLKDFGFFFNLICLPIALGVIVYGTRIAHFFSKIKERALETRTNQLLALNRIGSTIRRAMNLKTVTDQVLKGVIQGLGFDVCFLALLAKGESKVIFYVPEGNIFTVKMEEILGRKLSGSFLPLEMVENSAYQSIIKNRIIIRNDFLELTRGLQPAITPAQSALIQKELGFKKFVITPLVAERRVVGALIGCSRKGYVEESVVDTLDNFANQAALAIESAQLFEELHQKNLELQQANKIKTDFLAIMSHELRTPLAAIMGYTEILLDNVVGETNSAQKESLSEVLKNSEHLLALINSVLDLAKVEAGKMELVLENFTVADVVTDVQQTLHPLLAKKEQLCLLDIPTDLPALQADPRKLRQILLNLVGNAIKFTQEKGHIVVSVQYYAKADVLAEEFHIKPHRFKNTGVFRIGVKDSGIGIKPEHLSHIFDIFNQVDSTFTRKYQGTGLGLALTKQLVELHGGIIAVSSSFGKGSEFKFILPEKRQALEELK